MDCWVFTGSGAGPERGRGGGRVIIGLESGMNLLEADE